jgi:hypothetical protein
MATLALRTVSVRREPATASLDAVAREAGLHPDLVRRFVRLGLLDHRGPLRAPQFEPGAAATLVRAVRLRRDLGLNYSGAILAVELLARIDALEARVRRYEG